MFISRSIVARYQSSHNIDYEDLNPNSNGRPIYRLQGDGEPNKTYRTAWIESLRSMAAAIKHPVYADPTKSIPWAKKGSDGSRRWLSTDPPNVATPDYARIGIDPFGRWLP